MNSSHVFRNILAAGVAVIAVSTPAHAQDRAFSVPAGDLKTALDSFSRQAGIQIIYKPDEVSGARTRGIRGVVAADAALDRILAGSGFVAERDPSGAIAITRATETQATGAVAEDVEDAAIVVTASRVERAGFAQPTPTTVLGKSEIRQAARANLQQVLNDQPQFRPTINPAVTVGGTLTGVAPVDLRGLGNVRTLALLNGRRFAGENNLNFVPTGLVERVEVVTGGASAAWGSGAVAGVVNIILNDDLDGFSAGAASGISSRGDAARLGFDASFGTRFAGGAGHFMIGAEYVDDNGIADRNSRPNLGSSGIVRVSPGSLTDLRTQLARDVNAYQSHGGVIASGILAGQTFNDDGTLRPFSGPNAQGVGGGDAVGLYDDLYAASPFERFNAYARASYEIGNARLWADVAYGRATSSYVFFPDFLIAPLTIQASNPFLSAGIRNQLAAAGQTSFTLSRVFMDVFPMRFGSVRENKEGAIGIEGRFGKDWKYSAHYSHGEVDTRSRFENSRIAANFARAINAVSSNGQIVCAVNADAIASNDDPACRPINPFGEGNNTPAALAYVRGTQVSNVVTKLDSAGFEIQGDPLSLWAGPVTIVVGAEARWEEQIGSRGALDAAGAFGLPGFGAPVSGGFSVKEGFGEIVVPLINAEGAVKADLNGAVRYSDYSTSGGIWSWKAGATLRLFDDLLLRATRSRDIRSPNVSELFSNRAIGIGPLVDQDTAGRTGTPGYNPNPAQVTTYGGGNPDLVPEIGKTLTLGASYAPSFLQGFDISVDYYDIKVKGAIATLSGSNLTLACARGSTPACARITRDATGTVTQVLSNAQNIASFETRGLDFEASYSVALDRIEASLPGTLRFRVLATYVDRFIFDTGLTRVDTAGDVGDATANAMPHWRGVLSVNYQNDRLGLDARLRYIGGGKFNHLLTTLIDNRVDARTYVDIGAQFKVTDRFTLFGNVSNLFDVRLPITTTSSIYYDTVGTMFTAGARVSF